jgi:hypothetical protein
MAHTGIHAVNIAEQTQQQQRGWKPAQESWQDQCLVAARTVIFGNDKDIWAT